MNPSRIEIQSAGLLLWYRLQGVRTSYNPRRKKSPERCLSYKDTECSSFQESLEGRLSSLYQEIKEFKGCALSKSCLQTVFSDGNPKASIMIVGEAPGAEEDRLGKPFVGLSGQLLDKMFYVLGWDRTSFYITNIVPWRPPFNRQPSAEEIAICLPFVERHIQIIKPKILVCMGAVACKALLRTQSNISTLQNSALTYPVPVNQELIPVFAFYHPAYLLRSPAQKRVVWRHMLRMKALLLEKADYEGLCNRII